MACVDPASADLSASQFAAQLQRLAGPDDLPLSGSLELTHRCNVRCTHCYLSHGDGELDAAGMHRLLDLLRDHGVLSLMLTGGEPLLRADFRELYSHAHRNGFLLTLFSNATLVDEDRADFLASARPRAIEVSVYGATKEAYESVTRVPGSFAAFRRGVQRLRERGLPLRLKAMILRSNAPELEAMRAWSEDDMGIPFRFDTVVFPRLDGDPGALAERTEAHHAARVTLRAESDRKLYLRAVENATSAPPDRRLFKCGAGSLTFHIDPNGLAYPCLMWRREPYDLLNGSVREWNRRVAELRSATLPEDSPCALCSHRLACPVCPANSLLEAGRAGAAPDYFCRLCEAQRELTASHDDSTLGE